MELNGPSIWILRGCSNDGGWRGCAGFLMQGGMNSTEAMNTTLSIRFLEDCHYGGVDKKIMLLEESVLNSIFPPHPTPNHLSAVTGKIDETSRSQSRILHIAKT